MRIYNTPDRQIEEIEPQNPPQVTVYTCGPTVYDYPHIGNWFTFIRYDLLIRTLKASGNQPKWALNITDVGHLVSDADEGEDKLEKGARREGKTAQQIAEYYTSYFLKGLERLNFIQPDYLPRATDHISEQIDLIKKLEEKGYTYKIDDGVYYDTSKFPQYADFAHLNLAEQETGARVEANAQKRNPSDFALWKFSPTDNQRDMEWDSPWGKGFPGWHLECSAMIHKYFGDTVDIHAGGIDHIPVHHTNEIAQSSAVTGKPLAKYWMHTNHILIDDEKIAKSQGNGITLEDVEAKGYSLQALRLLVLQSHYRTQSVFSWEVMEAAQNRLNYLQAAADLRHQDLKLDGDLGSLDFGSYKSDIFERMSDDLNSPLALTVLNNIADELHQLGAVDREGVKDFFEFIYQLFGLNLLKEDITQEQKELIAQRETARKNQDWQKADELREQLSKQGIEINDTEHGPIWYRR
jgi:cysteinyl-tRNA synthetase